MHCHNCGSTVPNGASFCPECGAALASSQNVGTEQPATVRPSSYAKDPAVKQQPKRGYGRMVRAFILIPVILVFDMLGVMVGSLFNLDVDVAGYAGMGIGACVCMLAMGWKSLVVPRASVFKVALRKGWWLLATSSFLALVDVVAIISGDYAISPDWPMHTLRILFMCAMIGLSEECMFRGLLLGGMLSSPRRKASHIMGLAIAAALLFGLAHVEWWALDYGDLISLAQAILKAIQMGILGFFFAAVVFDTGSVLGPALLHGISNFILLFVYAGLCGQPLTTEYVVTGSEAPALIGIYLFAIAMYIPLGIIGVRSLKTATTTPFDE